MKLSDAFLSHDDGSEKLVVSTGAAKFSGMARGNETAGFIITCLEQETTDILGNAVACYTIPIMVGRNLAMVIEAAALNHRVKKMGYNAAEELKRRVNENVEKRLKERAENEEKEQE